MRKIALFTLISASLMSFNASAETYCPQTIQCSYLNDKCVADGDAGKFTMYDVNFSEGVYTFSRAYSAIDNSQPVMCNYNPPHDKGYQITLYSHELKAKLSGSGSNAWSRMSENDYICESNASGCPFTNK